MKLKNLTDKKLVTPANTKQCGGGKLKKSQSSATVLAKHLSAQLSKFAGSKKSQQTMRLTEALDLIQRRLNHDDQFISSKRSDPVQSHALVGLPRLNDYIGLGSVLQLTPIIKAEAPIDHVQSKKKAADVACITLAWVEQNNQRLLVFAPPEIVIAVQMLIQSSTSLSAVSRWGNPAIFGSVRCVNLTDVHHQTFRALLDDREFLKAHEKELNRCYVDREPLKQVEYSDLLNKQLLQMLSAGFLEAYFRQHKPVDKFRSVPQKFRDLHFDLSDAQWNALRIKPLGPQFDALCLAATNTTRANVDNELGSIHLNFEGTRQIETGGVQ